MNRGSAKMILAAYETDQLKLRMLNYPLQIFNKKKDVRQLRDAFADAELTRSLLEAEMLQDIGDEKDPGTGKPRYSNEGSRAAEMIKRKAESRGYQSAMQKAKNAGYALSEAQDELEMLMDAFKAARYVTRLVSEEIALMAMDDTENEDPLGLMSTVSKEPY